MLAEALAEKNIVLREDAMRRDESLLPRFSASTVSFYGRLCRKRATFNILKRVYETIYPIKK